MLSLGKIKLFSGIILRNGFRRSIRCFSEINEKQHDLQFIENPDNTDELIIKVPIVLQPLINYGNLNQFQLYENLSSIKYFTSFVPAHKFNFLLFSIYTYFSYGTAVFQPSLLLTLYLMNKFFLVNTRKSSEVLAISLYADGTALLIRTYFGTLKLELGDTKISPDLIKIGNKQFFQLQHTNVKAPLYICQQGKYGHYELFTKLMSGKYLKAKFEYI
jgi:hypothetical protein